MMTTKGAKRRGGCGQVGQGGADAKRASESEPMQQMTVDDLMQAAVALSVRGLPGCVVQVPAPWIAVFLLYRAGATREDIAEWLRIPPPDATRMLMGMMVLMERPEVALRMKWLIDAMPRLPSEGEGEVVIGPWEGSVAA